ncbi:cytochrome P450 [Telluribacter sp. SYSU D00476]|uniref:cytochrome P450 n=1 Tax=Telluribacter sp. SYSU D00476 TaxID=2811430 RepID=UPI001FF283BB|nr:cytochrome P450 [Telluribacter sp. SYSU D00476]
MPSPRFSKPKGPGVREAQRLIRTHKNRAWVELALRYGKSFFYQGTLVTCDAQLVEQLLMQRVHTRTRSIVYKKLNQIIPLAPGLLFMDGEPWQRRLEAVMPAFTKARVDTYAGYMHDCIVSYVEQWGASTAIPDLYREIVNLNAEHLFRAGLGLDPQTEHARELGQALIDFKFDLMDPDARLDWFGFSENQLRRFPAFLKAQWRRRRKAGQLRRAVERVSTSEVGSYAQGLNWIHCLRETGFTNEEVTHEVNHLYGAYNALDYAFTGAFYELSRHPQWALLLRNELAEVLGPEGYPTRDTFQALPHTLRFMREVFRCYPVSMGVSRRTGEELRVGELTLPAGQEVLILLHALHHHPDYWDQPDTFDPDRWKEEPRFPYAYVPFLKGPRHCIGRHLAELNFVLVLNAILQRFDIQVHDHEVPLAPYMMPRFERELTCTMARHKEPCPVKMK